MQQVASNLPTHGTFDGLSIERGSFDHPSNGPNECCTRGRGPDTTLVLFKQHELLPYLTVIRSLSQATQIVASEKGPVANCLREEQTHSIDQRAANAPGSFPQAVQAFHLTLTHIVFNLISCSFRCCPSKADHSFGHRESIVSE